jgi:hypothetical protein
MLTVMGLHAIHFLKLSIYQIVFRREHVASLALMRRLGSVRPRSLQSFSFVPAEGSTDGFQALFG